MDIKGFFNGAKDVLQSRYKRYISTAAAAAYFFALNQSTVVPMKPEVIIAGLPFFSVNKIGHASSDEIMKYRSMGGVFLAHQKGTKQTFKFTALFYGAWRYTAVKMLEGLLMLGSEEAKKISAFAPGGGLTPGGFMNYLDIPKKNVLNPNSIHSMQSKAPFYEYEGENEFADLDYAYHMTYPIITDSRIYTDMYMETIVINEDIKFGKDCVEVQCAFRQYIPPTHYQRSDPEDDTKGRKKVYRTYVPYEQLQWLQRMDYLLNAGWVANRFINDYFGDQEIYQLERNKIMYEGGRLVATMAFHYATSKL